MRIIAGIAGGVKLAAPAGLGTRPTSDRVREALFNIIRDKVGGARFLDLFAGSGAVGLEALSRGADDAVFVDSRLVCAQIIRQNAEKTRLSDQSRILAMGAGKALALLAREKQSFDIVYLDPPYERGGILILDSLKAIEGHGLLAAGGLIAAELEQSGPDLEVEIRGAGLGFEVIRKQSYGGTVLVFIESGFGV